MTASPPKFLPTYVGSKSYWVNRLESLRGRTFVELFAGSAALSSALAGRAFLSDTDVQLTTILRHFDRQKMIDPFTEEDYMRVRKRRDWWRYAFCLQSMSYSGVFRWSKNGYNVPAKKGLVRNNTESYAAALERWRELKPTVQTQSYEVGAATLLKREEGHRDVVVILDPPYENSQASYNAGKFDFDRYWEVAAQLTEKYNVILFDRAHNLHEHGFEVHGLRNMRVNGGRDGDKEGISIQFKDATPGEILAGAEVVLAPEKE